MTLSSLPVRRLRRIDASIVVLAAVLAFLGAGIAQGLHAWGDAQRGLLIYERARKDAYIDAGLIARSSHVPLTQSLVSALRLQTVLVMTRSSESSAFVGSGVIVANRKGELQILTAKHVLAHPGAHFVLFGPREGRRAIRVIRALNDDLALLIVPPVPGMTYAVSHFAKNELATGTPFVVMGHPGARSWIASSGLAERHARQTLLFCPTCDRGDSGAGVFDKSGALRGIIVLKSRISAPAKRTGRTFTFTAFEAEPLSRVRPFVRTALRA